MNDFWRGVLVVYGKENKHWMHCGRYRDEWEMYLWIHSDKPMWAVPLPHVGEVYKCKLS